MPLSDDNSAKKMNEHYYQFPYNNILCTTNQLIIFKQKFYIIFSQYFIAIHPAAYRGGGILAKLG